MDLIQREECARTGIYFLVGQDPEDSLPSVYIGESDDVANRLKQHNRTEDAGGKDFWEKVCLVTGKDQNITKTHIKYLESRLIDIAKRSDNAYSKMAQHTSTIAYLNQIQRIWNTFWNKYK